MEAFVLAIIAGLSAAIFKSSVRVDREYERGVMFRLGRFQTIKGPGLYFTVPIVDQKVQVIRTKTVDIAPQEAVTADSVTIKINAVLYYRIIDPIDRKSTRLNSSHRNTSRMPSSA